MKIEPAVVDLSTTRIACDRCRLATLCLPGGLSSEDITEIDKIIRHNHTLRRGDFLFRNGDKLSALYAVRSGSFKVFIYTDAGSEQILGFYFPGEIIGFDAINNYSHVSSALALETGAYCVLPFAQLEKLSSAVPEIGRASCRERV